MSNRRKVCFVFIGALTATILIAASFFVAMKAHAESGGVNAQNDTAAECSGGGGGGDCITGCEE